MVEHSLQIVSSEENATKVIQVSSGTLWLQKLREDRKDKVNKK